ncbi:MAG: hypothetical protein JNJ91_05140 [Flavobacteriales bacterium]|nr:hypothetical protein [Flavobacteriales bacterium]
MPYKNIIATIHHPAYSNDCGKVWLKEDGNPIRMEVTGTGMIAFLNGVMVKNGVVITARLWDYEFITGLVQFGCMVRLERYDHDEIHDIKGKVVDVLLEKLRNADFTLG